MEMLPQTLQAFDKLMSLEKIEHQHLQQFTPDEKAAFMDELCERIARNPFEHERDKLVKKSMAILDNDFVWSYNHNKIVTAIQEHYRKFGVMPSTAHLGAVCRLSRKTVDHHIDEFAHHADAAQTKKMKSVVDDTIMEIIIKAACKGDLKAAKLYLQNKQANKQAEATVNTQHNYVHINNTVINQQVIQQLKPEQLKMIEQIIAGGGEKLELRGGKEE